MINIDTFYANIFIYWFFRFLFFYIKKKILEKDGKQKREILNICQCLVDCLFEHLLTLQDSNSKVFYEFIIIISFFFLPPQEITIA